MEDLERLFEDFRSSIFPDIWRDNKLGFTKKWRGFLFHIILTQGNAFSWTFRPAADPDADVVQANGVVDNINLAMAACFCKWAIEQKLATREEVQSWWVKRRDSIRAHHEALKVRIGW